MRIISLLVVSTLLVACGNNEEEKNIINIQKQKIKECIEKGYSYYDSLGYGEGNYKLHNGRMRDDEVRIRCERQPQTAFG